MKNLDVNALMKDYKKIDLYEERQKLVEKWKNTGLLEKLTGDVKIGN